MSNYDPADRPDPSEQPIRARVPEHVSGGAFSTGVIVMTAQTEFILDFVQNLGRPHQIVSRVIMPHNVLPQLVDALHRNMELYRSRWGELPQPPGQNPPAAQSAGSGPAAPPAPAAPGVAENKPTVPAASSAAAGAANQKAQGGAGSGGPSSGSAPQAGFTAGPPDSSSSDAGGSPPSGGQPPASSPPPAGSGARQASAQEIYDDLKIRDELLSGAYANAVMIGHGPHEFSFDFITNFYPHSAVSARVFLAAGQIPRLYDSLKGTWDQLRQRMQPPGGSPPPFPRPGGPDDNPIA